jgi:hypothetical protein
MKQRKAISKKVRFEVFKRDSFKCQYCGCSAPDVILHIDHIQPVSKGGDNDITNLITSCFDCNMGKKDRQLDDNSVIAKQKQQLDELNERRNQLAMMLSWRKELQLIKKTTAQIAVDEWNLYIDGYHLNESGEDQVGKLVSKYGIDLVLEAMEIAAEKYLPANPSNEDCSNAFGKIGGICNLKSQPEWKQQLAYICGICRNRHHYHNKPVLMKRLQEAYEAGVEIDQLTEMAKYTRNWTDMMNELDMAIASMRGE